jgi:hypothetical protein
MTERRVVRLLARYRVASLDEFVERHEADLASSGIFVRTESPLEVGAFVEFECRGDDDEALLAALGRVVRVRELADAREGFPAGMALQFLRVDKGAERALEKAERSSRFGLRVEADDRSWSAQQRVSQGLSTPPPPPTAPGPRIEVRVDASLAAPPAEAERTPPLFAALTGGDHAALRPGRVPAGFEVLVRHGSAPDSSEVAAITPRSAIARPFLVATDLAETPRQPFIEEVVGAPLSPLAETLRAGSMPPTPVSIGAVVVPSSSAGSSRPPASSGVDAERRPEAGPSIDPLAAAIVEPPARDAASAPVPSTASGVVTPSRGSSVGLWVALLAAVAGGLWLAEWLAAEPPAPPAGAERPRR